MKSRLDLIEARLQAFIERSLVSFLPWDHSQNRLAQQLVQAMREPLNPDVSSDSPGTIPNRYTIQVHPSQLAYWQSNPAYLDELAETLNQAATEAGFHFSALPLIRLEANPDLAVSEVHIQAATEINGLDSTAVMETNPLSEGSNLPDIPSNAFLIVNGVRIFPLTQTVINLGRRRDNHLVVDDPRVSRIHAQMRATRGRYILFDLNSTGGTYVNGQRIIRAVLKPGDVISLAGIPMVFSQDIPSSPVDTGTPPSTLENGSTDRIQSQHEEERFKN